MRPSSELLIYGGMVLVVLGVAIAITLVLLVPRSFIRVLWTRYTDRMNDECRFLFYKTTGAEIGRKQLFATALLLSAAVLLSNTLFLVVLLFVWLIPIIILQRWHADRVTAIETQLDSWLMLFANALKATPSLGEGIKATAKIVRAPIAQELDLVIKEMNLGNPLDQAMMNMSRRIGSPIVAGVVATVLVGRQTGGDMPQILEQSASTLREMARLEGVFRTKTAEGKAQAYLLTVMPLVLIFVVQWMDPAWFEPLMGNTLGYVMIIGATVCWIAAVILTRQILTVNA